MKKFSELVVGDKCFEYFEGNIFEHEVTGIENQYGNIYLSYGEEREIIFKKCADEDFLIYSQGLYCDGISWAVSTSMDRLLLEVGEE